MSAPPTTLRTSTARIAALAWPVLVGQVALLAFSTIDTALLARHLAADLAALAVGEQLHQAVWLALALPASLLFTAYRGFNNAVSRPKAVMARSWAGWP